MNGLKKGDKIVIGGEQVAFVRKTEEKVQFKDASGKLKWAAILDCKLPNSATARTVKSRDEVLLEDKKLKAKATGSTPRERAYQESADRLRQAQEDGLNVNTMGELITHYILDNPEMSNKQLCEEFNLPNPVYVSKLRKKISKG